MRPKSQQGGWFIAQPMTAEQMLWSSFWDIRLWVCNYFFIFFLVFYHFISNARQGSNTVTGGLHITGCFTLCTSLASLASFASCWCDDMMKVASPNFKSIISLLFLWKDLGPPSQIIHISIVLLEWLGPTKSIHFLLGFGFDKFNHQHACLLLDDQRWPTCAYSHTDA